MYTAINVTHCILKRLQLEIKLLKYMSRSKEIPGALKTRIVEAYNDKEGYQMLSKWFGVSSVHKLFFKKKVLWQSRNGYPRKTSARAGWRLVRQPQANPAVFPRFLANVQTSTERRNRNDAGCHGRKPLLTKKNKEARLNLTKAHINKLEKFW